MSPSEYIVAHGCSGSLGRFRNAEGPAITRGDYVVVRSRRGLELGTVLGLPTRASFPDEFVGELIRAATPVDRQSAERQSATARQLCADADDWIAKHNLAFTVIDAEVFLDERSAILHGLSLSPCDPSGLLEHLGVAHNLIVRLYDLAEESPTPVPAADHEEAFKCDKPDCGEGKCDNCESHGGCSSCSSGGAKELAAHFAALREQMEQSRIGLI